MAKYKVTRGADEQYYFELEGDEGDMWLQSEGYTTKASAFNGIESVKENSALDNRYLCKNAKDGSFYFVLLAKNGEIIGTSKMNPSMIGRDNLARLMMSAAPGAPIEDQTRELEEVKPEDIGPIGEQKPESKETTKRIEKSKKNRPPRR
jgi:uncharacterized protein YegP (UPF0339 family)